MPSYSRAEWESRRVRLREQVLAAAGLLPMPSKTPLNPRRYGIIEHDDYVIENVVLETRPGFFLGGNLYRPRNPRGRLPAVLSPHGHWEHGRLENRPDYSVPALGVNLARQGYIVFAHDMVGYNDTRQLPHEFGHQPEEALWSFNSLGLQLWNSIRALDYLGARADVDPARLAVTGASGGATQTFLLAAVDHRVRAAAPVNMVSGMMQGGCECENAPNLRLDTFNVELAALMAPRPMLLIAVTGDWTRNSPREEFPAIRRIYAQLGAAANIETLQFDAQHNYNRQSREAVYAFFARRFLPAAHGTPFLESDFRMEARSELLAFRRGESPAQALDYDRLFERWKAEARAQAAEPVGLEELRRRLAAAIAIEWPTDLWASMENDRFLLGRSDRGDRIPGRWLRQDGPDGALIVHPKGADEAIRSGAAAELFADGYSVMSIDAFQTGWARAPRDRSGRYFLTFNQSDDAHRLQDIVTALSFLRSACPGRIRLVGLDKAGIWCLFAAAVARTPLEIDAPLNGFRGADDDFLQHFFVPGIQRAGGLDVALRLTQEARRKTILPSE